MPGILSRWRYELIGVGTSVLIALFLLATAQPRIAVEGSKSGSVWASITSGAQALEGRATDLKFKLRGARPPSSDVIVLAADEKGAQRFGLWPWPRDVQARAYDRLLDAGVKVIALDIGYLDPSSQAQSSVELLKRLDAVGELPEQLVGLRDELRAAASKSPDDELEAVFRKAGPRIVQGVIPYADAAMQSLTKEQVARYEADAEPHLIRKVPLGTSGAFREFNVDRIEAFKQDMVQTPLARFARTGSRLGHFEAVTDSDGAIRHAALLMKLEQVKAFLPSIALQAAAQALDAHIEPIVEDDALHAIALRRADGVRQIIPMEGMCAFMAINYDGPGTAFTTLSMSDVIDGQFDPAAVKDKIVLAGVTITGLTGDQRVTPFSEMEPGVYTHAAALSNIVRHDFLTRSFGQILMEALALVLIGLIFGLVVPRVPSFALKGVFIALVLGGWWGASLWLFSRGQNVSLVLPSASILTVLVRRHLPGLPDSVDREKLHDAQHLHPLPRRRRDGGRAGEPRAPQPRREARDDGALLATFAASPRSPSTCRPRSWPTSSTSTSRR